MKQILEEKTAHPIRVFEDDDKYLVETSLLPTFFFSPPSTLLWHKLSNGIASALLGSLILFIFIKTGNYYHYYAEFFIFAGIPIMFFLHFFLLLFKKPTERYYEYNSTRISNLTHHNNKTISFFMYKKSKKILIYIHNNLFRTIHMEEGNIFLYEKENYFERAIHYRGGINNTLVKFTFRVIPRKMREDTQREMDALIPILNHVHTLTFAATNTHANVSSDSTVTQHQVAQKNINPLD